MLNLDDIYPSQNSDAGTGDAGGWRGGVHAGASGARQSCCGAARRKCDSRADRAAKEQMGLNDPYRAVCRVVYRCAATRFWQLVLQRQTVTETLSQRKEPTIFLTTYALMIEILIGIPCRSHCRGQAQLHRRPGTDDLLDQRSGRADLFPGHCADTDFRRAIAMVAERGLRFDFEDPVGALQIDDPAGVHARVRIGGAAGPARSLVDARRPGRGLRPHRQAKGLHSARWSAGMLSAMHLFRQLR